MDLTALLRTLRHLNFHGRRRTTRLKENFPILIKKARISSRVGFIYIFNYVNYVCSASMNASLNDCNEFATTEDRNVFCSTQIWNFYLRNALKRFSENWDT